MKRLLLVLLIVIPCFSWAADSTNVVSQEKISETERLIDKYGGKAIQMFNNAAEKITPFAEEGFKMAVKMQIAYGVACLVPAVLFFIFLWIFIREYRRVLSVLESGNVPDHMNKNGGPFYELNFNAVMGMSLAMSCIMFIIGMVTTADGILHLMAPEWYAIKEIFEMVGIGK